MAEEELLPLNRLEELYIKGILSFRSQQVFLIECCIITVVGRQRDFLLKIPKMLCFSRSVGSLLLWPFFYASVLPYTHNKTFSFDTVQGSA